MDRLRAALTVPAFRGDVVAAGVVALVTAATLLVARTDHGWSPGARLAFLLPLLALVGALAVLAPQARGPAPFHHALYLAALVVLVLALRDVARVLGAHPLAGAGVQLAFAAAVLVAAGWLARARDSAPCTLVAAVAAAWCVVAAVVAVADPAPVTLRWPLLGLFAAFTLGAVARRDRVPRHAAALADAGGLAALAIASLSIVEDAAGAGWELLLFAAGFGLLAYGAVDRERVAAGLGGLVTAAAVGVAAIGAEGLLWWPLGLAAGGGALLAIGLRPTTPAPPPPDAERAVAEPVPLEAVRRR